MVHQYKNNGYNIILDVCSGSVHVTDDLVYDIIAVYKLPQSDEDICDIYDDEGQYEATDIADDLPDRPEDEVIRLLTGKGYDEADVREAYEDVTFLKDAGQLFTPDVYKDIVIDFKKHITVVKALCLNVSHDCNLACRYCFAGQGEYHGERAMMSYEVGKQALDFLIANSGNRRNLEVDFFGGEPLMNWDVVKRLVEYGRSIEKEAGKNFRFTMTTNGVLLSDEVAEFANRELKNVVLSIDGRKEINDRMRPTVNGKGSYDIIMPKFKKFAAQRQGEYYVRGTYTHDSIDFSRDVENLMEEGFDEISMEPVVAPRDMPYAITEEDVPVLKKQYDILAKDIIKRAREGRPVNFFHFNIDLSGGPCVYKRLSGCGAGTEYLAVTPWGDLYPCHQFVGIDEFRIGDVWKGVERDDIVSEFKLCNVYAKPKCRSCFARFFCSGGCAANSYQFHGKLNDAYDIGCDLERKRVECAIMIKAALEDEGIPSGGTAQPLRSDPDECASCEDRGSGCGDE